jgi:hypothetical protein
MNKLFTTLSILAAIAIFTTACGAQIAQAAESDPAAFGYQSVLGKSVTEQNVAELIDSNCTQAGSFQICQRAGFALWVDPNQIVQFVYLYVNGTEDFSAYKGELPFGLESTDTMADVEHKLGSPKEIHAPQAGWKPGQPDEGGSPDRIHYWATYKRFGMTVIYNTPAANDKAATLYAVLISQDCDTCLF